MTMTMKSKIALLINDIHIDRATVDTAITVFNDAVKYAVENGIEDIIIGGDVFTNRSGQPLMCLNAWRSMIDHAATNKVHLHVIPGNHDKTDPDDIHSYLNVFGDGLFNHLYMYESAINIRGVEFVLIPHFSKEKWCERLKVVAKERNFDCGVSILVTHIAINGVRNNDGTVVEDAIEPSLLDSYSKVLVGHYHNASHVGKNIYYTGSAYQNNFGETISDKGFTVIYDDGSLEHVQSRFPRFVNVEIKATDRESLKNIVEKYSVGTEDRVRIKIVGTRSECEKINVQEIRDAGIECKFSTDEENQAVEIACTDSVTTFDKAKIKKAFLEFCGENGIRGNELKAGLEYLKIM